MFSKYRHDGICRILLALALSQLGTKEAANETRINMGKEEARECSTYGPWTHESRSFRRRERHAKEAFKVAC